MYGAIGIQKIELTASLQDPRLADRQLLPNWTYFRFKIVSYCHTVTALYESPVNFMSGLQWRDQERLQE